MTVVKKPNKKVLEKTEESEDLLESVSTLMTMLTKTYGKDLIRSMKDIEEEDVEIVSTGSLRLDFALKEPLSPGVHELSGSEGAGKTTMALEAGANAQKLGMTFYYINMERGLNKSLPKGIPNLDRRKMYVVSPNDGHECLDVIENIIRSIPRSFIVLDSVTALVSEEEMSKSSDENTMGMLGRILSKFLKKMNPMINDQGTVLLFLNQLRDNLGYGAKEVTTGGRAIKFYSHSRVSLKAPKSGQRMDKRGNLIGQTVIATVIKNRATIPFKVVEVELLFGHGIDKTLEIIKLAIEFDIIKKGGSWFSYLKDNGEELKTQGQETLVEMLSNNKELFTEVKGKIIELYG